MELPGEFVARLGRLAAAHLEPTAAQERRPAARPGRNDRGEASEGWTPVSLDRVFVCGCSCDEWGGCIRSPSFQKSPTGRDRMSRNDGTGRLPQTLVRTMIVFVTTLIIA